MERFTSLTQRIHQRSSDLESNLKKDNFGDFIESNLEHLFKIVHFLLLLKDFTGIGYLTQLNNLVARYERFEFSKALKVYQILWTRLQGFTNLETPNIDIETEIDALAFFAAADFESGRLEDASVADLIKVASYDLRLTGFFLLKQFLDGCEIGVCSPLFEFLRETEFLQILELDEELKTLSPRELIMCLSPDQAVKLIPDYLTKGVIEDTDPVIRKLISYFRSRENQDHEVLHNLGILAASSGENELAVTWLRKALDLRLQIFSEESEEISLTKRALETVSNITQDGLPETDNMSEKEFLDFILAKLQTDEVEHVIFLIKNRLKDL